jgi:hypothetical protein
MEIRKIVCRDKNRNCLEDKIVKGMKNVRSEGYGNRE